MVDKCPSWPLAKADSHLVVTLVNTATLIGTFIQNHIKSGTTL